MGNLLNGASFREPTTLEECDSTWESDSGPEGEQGDDEDTDAEESGAEEPPPDSPVTHATGQSDRTSAEQSIKPKRSFYAARDLYKYRHQYPNFKDLRCQNDLCNLGFYMNKIPFKPDGIFIEEILNTWKSQYEKLEYNHTYIQWLFPLREQGLNFYAKELTSYEIEEFKKTREAMKRFIMAYKMMLDFFGLKLVDKNGKISRATNWQERFQHLNDSPHNYLRITRILKSLGELGYEHFKPPLVKVFLQESIVENTIPNMKQSALEYFVYTVKDRRERRRLLRFARHHYLPPEHFIWGPPKKERSQAGKSCNKTRHSNRSQKKHLHKAKSKECEHLIETPANALEEKKILYSQAEERRQETRGAEEDIDVKLENDLEQPENKDDNPLSDESKFFLCAITDINTENVIKLESIERVIVVDTTVESSKDCLCSLSSVTSDGSTATLHENIPETNGGSSTEYN
ncbi:opioid growth factor receptor-like protein 1 [Gastrophryne carolinensis]